MSFLPDIVKKGWTEEEVFGICFESERERNRRRLQAIVCDHHLKDVKEFLAYQQLATWNRENGFDRVEAVDHRSLPPTSEQYYAGLWLEVNALKDAISMPLQLLKLINAIEQDKLSDKEYATLKRCMEKRVREEAQAKAQMTAKPVGTVQQGSPSSPNPDTPSDVCFNLENEGTMSQELEELTSSSVGTGLNTPGQQSPPNEGVWETGRIIADGILTAGVDSSKEGNISSPMESVDTRASEKSTSTATVADIPSPAATPSKRRLKTFNELNKPFDPGGREEQAPPWKAAVPLPFFSGCEAGGLLVRFLCSVFFCLFSRSYVFPFTGESYQQNVFSIRGQVMYATGGQAFPRLLPYLKMARTSNAWFGRSANTLG